MASLVRRRGSLFGMWRLVLVLALVLSIQGLAPSGTQAQGLARETLADYDVVNGHFFTQAGGRNGDQGFSVTDDGGVPFWSEFRRLGGIETLGYPVSRRFMWD